MENIDLSELFTNHVIPWAIRIAAALAIFIIGRMVAGSIARLLKKVLTKADMGPILIDRKAKEIFHQILNDDQRVLEDPELSVAPSELADSSVNFVVRPWVESGDYWAARFDITEQVKLRFDAEGISIPFPQMDVHLAKTE